MTTFAAEGGVSMEVGVAKGRGLLQMMPSLELPVERGGSVEVALGGHFQGWGHLRFWGMLLSRCSVEEGAWVGVDVGVVRGKGLRNWWPKKAAPEIYYESSDVW